MLGVRKSKRSRDLTHRKLRSLLRNLRPGEAAFVLHLAGCERCRGLVPRFVSLDEANPAMNDYPGSLAPLERDLLLDLIPAGFLLSLADRTQDDLPPTELRRFLKALSPEQLTLIRQLLDHESCRITATKVLAPQDRRPARPSEASNVSRAEVLS